MTGNQIAYYKARNERRNMRLERKEQKRHNLEAEQASKMSAAASMIGAQASATQANVAQKQYQLGWEKEYGLPYGSDPNDMSNFTHVKVGDQYYLIPKNNAPTSFWVEGEKQLETRAKREYEEAQTRSKKVETAQRAVDTIIRAENAISGALNLGKKFYNMFGTSAPEAGSPVPGTDLIVYGGQ